MSLYELADNNAVGYRDVSPLRVAETPPGVRLVDVREQSEFHDALGHIPGAELVPLGTLTQHASQWNKADEIVVICRSGGRSSYAALELHKLGFERVMNMRGGMMAYNQAHLPIER
jgi:sulfur-carrier protein adenylyltransferase/sulfurtransferase